MKFNVQQRRATRYMMLTGNIASEATVRVGPMVNLAAVIRSLGHEPAQIMQDSGFQPRQFSNAENHLSFLATSRLLANCVSVTGAEHLGLLLGELATPSHLGIAGFMVNTAESVELALASLVDNLDLHDQGGIARLVSSGDYTRLSYKMLQPNAAAAAQIYDLSAVMLHKIMRCLCGAQWQAASVELPRPMPADIAPYQRIFNTQLYFDSVESAITFHNDWLTVTPPANDALLFQHLEEEAAQLHDTHRADLMDTLPAALQQALLCGQVGTAEVAASVGLHERTLHRRLRERGTSFRSELDRARRTMSEELLRSTTLPVCDIATALGYADSSSFIRAFQRWCDTSPNQWRRLNCPQDVANQHAS